MSYRVLGVNISKNFLFVFAVTLLFLMVTHSAWAANTSGGGLPSDEWFTKLQKSVTGPWAFTFAIVGIVGAGATLIFGGDINSFLRTIIFLVLVLSFIVAAQGMLTAITGQSAEVAEILPSSCHFFQVHRA